MFNVLKIVALNVLIVLVLVFAVDQLLGLLGFPSDVTVRASHRPNVSKVLKTIEFEYDFSTNELGLRYRPIPLQKPPGEVRILMLGDSFTEGVGVQAHETFGHFLEHYYSTRLDKDVLFINAGLGGKGPLDFWRVFKDVGVRLHPDALLLCIYANDLMDTKESLTLRDLQNHRPHRQGLSKFLHSLFPRVYMLLNEAGRIIVRELRQRKAFVDNVTDIAREKGVDEGRIQRWRSRLSEELVRASDKKEFNMALLSAGLFNPHYWEEALDVSTLRAEKKYQAMTLILTEIADLARANGMAIGLVFVPAPLQYDSTRHQNWNPWIMGGVKARKRWASELSEIQRRLEIWAHARNIPLLDLTRVLRTGVSSGRTLNFKLDGHWNAAGHRFTGEAIAQWIDGHHVFPVLSQEGTSP